MIHRKTKLTDVYIPDKTKSESENSFRFDFVFKHTTHFMIMTD